MSAKETVHRGGRKPLAMLGLKPLGDLLERDVHGLLDHRQDRRAKRFDPARALVATHRPRRDRAGLAPETMPLHRRRRRDAKPGRGRPAALTAVDRIHDAASEIKGERFGHEGWPPHQPSR